MSTKPDKLKRHKPRVQFYVATEDDTFRSVTTRELVDALIAEGGETIWWCLPYHEYRTMDEPCVAGSTHDWPHDCHWRLVFPIPAEEETTT